MKSSEAPLSYLQNTDRRTADNVNSLKHVAFKKNSVRQKKPKNHFYFFLEKIVIQIYIPISRGGFFFSLSSALTHSSFTIKRVCYQYQQNRMKWIPAVSRSLRQYELKCVRSAELFQLFVQNPEHSYITGNYNFAWDGMGWEERGISWKTDGKKKKREIHRRERESKRWRDNKIIERERERLRKKWPTNDAVWLKYYTSLKL